MQDRRRRGEKDHISVYMAPEVKRRVQAFAEAADKSDSRVVLEWIEEKLRSLGGEQRVSVA
jgi:predicted transcriptional regulator